MTGDAPYKEIKKAMNVPKAVTEGQLPDRPTDLHVMERGMNDGLWTLLMRCWTKIPLERPSICVVNESLKTLWS